MTLIQKELKNAYIGEYKGWHPSSDTIVWYKLETDTKDYSGNNRDATNNWVTFSDGFWTFSTTNNSSSQWPYIQYDNWLTWWFKTISCWFYKTYSINWMLCVWDVSRNISNWYIQLRTQNPNWFSIKSSSVWNVDVTNGSYTVQFNKWHLFTLTQNVANNVSWGWTLKIYLDGNYYGTKSWHIDYRVYIIWSWKESNNSYYYNFPWKLSNFIIETKEWSAQDVTDYYNLTKWQYWY